MYHFAKKKLFLSFERHQHLSKKLAEACLTLFRVSSSFNNSLGAEETKLDFWERNTNEFWLIQNQQSWVFFVVFRSRQVTGQFSTFSSSTIKPCCCNLHVWMTQQTVLTMISQHHLRYFP